ncbi:MAG: Hpt domain-containing protein [Acidimicrobiia bacterium]
MTTPEPDAIYEALAHLWVEAHADAWARYDTIAAYVDARTTREPWVRTDAHDALAAAATHAAHQLAGSLGTFGFPTGSEVARMLERAIMTDSGDATTCAHLNELTRALAEILATNAPSSTPA